MPMRIVEPVCAVFRRHLRSVGLKYTPERARVLAAVLSMPGPFLVDDLLANLRAAEGKSAPRVSKATAYRTVKLLADSGVLQKLLLISEQAHYVVAIGQTSAGSAPSALIVQTDTGAATQVDAPELATLAAKLAAKHGAKMRGYRLILYTEG